MASRSAQTAAAISVCDFQLADLPSVSSQLKGQSNEMAIPTHPGVAERRQSTSQAPTQSGPPA